MDWSEKNLCIKCNEGGNLLVCSENGCPLAIHGGCMGCPARFDDAGHFYCPYCLYKQAVAESRQAREYALARKKALLIFMDEELIGSERNIEKNKRAEDNGHNQSKISEANVNIATCYDGKSKSNNNAILDQPIQLDGEHKISTAEEEKIQEGDSEASAGSKGQDPSPKTHEEQSISNEEEKKIQEDEHESSAASSGQDPPLKMHEQKISDADEGKIREEECETSSASTGQDAPLTVHVRAKRGFKRSEPIDRDSDAVSVKSKLHKLHDEDKQTSPTVTPPRRSSRRSSSALRTEKVLNEEVGASRRLKQPEQPSVKL